MIELPRILCPIDFSDASRRALQHAVALARWYGSTITVQHVGAIAPAPSYPAAGVFPSIVLTDADRAAMLDTVKMFAEPERDAKVAMEFEFSEGLIADEILRKAAAMPSSLLVLGTHGRGGIDRAILGSVTETVLRKAACPVLVVPPGVSTAADAPSAAFKNIVCAIDFSDGSMEALRYAMSLAQEANASLTVVHVLELPPGFPPGADDGTPGASHLLREYAASLEHQQGARLESAIPDNVRSYCTVSTVLLSGKPYREILRLASERAADLIVVGVHGRSPLDRLFFGSTTQQLVRHAPCPVLTLRQG